MASLCQHWALPSTRAGTAKQCSPTSALTLAALIADGVLHLLCPPWNRGWVGTKRVDAEWVDP